jgi:hypothetical protein
MIFGQRELIRVWFMSCCDVAESCRTNGCSHVFLGNFISSCEYGPTRIAECWRTRRARQVLTQPRYTLIQAEQRNASSIIPVRNSYRRLTVKRTVTIAGWFIGYFQTKRHAIKELVNVIQCQNIPVLGQYCGFIFLQAEHHKSCSTRFHSHSVHNRGRCRYQHDTALQII